MTPELQLFFSTSRLAKYQQPGETTEQGFARYQWNVQLAEALLPSLNYFEIGLRNGLDRAITALYGKDWLLNVPKALGLNESDLELIEKNKDETQRRKGCSAKNDDIVAKLGFGFWSALFHNRYDPILWQRDRALAIVFPNMPRTLRTRKYIAPKLHQIRIVRNRIAHHEPIWRTNPDVQAFHQVCIEMIHAMSLAAAQELAKIDRFPEVYSRGLIASGTRNPDDN